MSEKNKIMLSFSHAAVGYGEKMVLQDVSFQVSKGEYVALIGSNGTGKSTLIKCVSGLLPLAGGEIEICGKDSRKLKAKERARLVAVVPQSYYVDYDFTVEDIVMMGRNPYIDFRHRESKEDHEIAERAMKLTKTDVFRDRPYNELSGGERQRVILARAITQQPQIILLDEPTSALDLHHQIEVMELIRDLNEKENITVMAVLHDINLASRFCSRIIILKDGKVKADGTPKQIINREEMESLYNMKLLVKNNPLLEKPEIIPIRVMDEEKVQKPLRIHVICGEKGGVRLLEQLVNMGHHVSAGVLNQESDDDEICRYLEIPRIEIGPFQPVSAEDQERNLKLMEDADVVVVADIPFGEANIRNLDGLENVKGELYMNENIKRQDFTEGLLEKRLQEIAKKKKIKFYGKDVMEK
ncbi:heme ABC transporter ATP-binding protein [Blautia sp. HCP3S3_H10_1]|uniref:heme ABC transporter ATP-binding protein n=1 Tax=unclassified Blautia TaxID=2648079 RepID=UPI003064712A|nr:heme ABC transporter ATP-binding protein [Lachnospiraceae bacterium]MDD5803404.1 heme ABC transporter ATP-binding protein [Clostridia bacterium]